VVTAAAAIMVCVFLSFMLGEDRVVEEFGLSLASAVFLDALVVRCLLLPALLHIVGETTWRLPVWLERRVPRIRIEGATPPGEDAELVSGAVLAPSHGALGSRARAATGQAEG
jgi:RND superfamily putative drug exporter